MKTEEELTQDFKDWLGWNDQDPPDQDDPDYYTYSWGLNVWINSHRAYQSKLSELPTERATNRGGDRRIIKISHC
jgi:hypothetical protein